MLIRILRRYFVASACVAPGLMLAACTADQEITGAAVQAAISTNLMTYTAGSTVTVTYDNMSGSATDWIAIAVAGAPATQYVQWRYTNGNGVGASQASMNFTNLAPGNYEARAFFNYQNGSPTDYTIRYSSSFSINAAATLTTDAPSYTAGSPVTVNWAGIPSPTARDWIQIAQQGSTVYNYFAWQYTGGTAAGSRVFNTTLPNGTYIARLLANDGYSVLATSAAFTVTGAVTPTLTPPVGAQGGVGFSVSFNNMPGNSTDWISIAPAGTPSSTYSAWQSTGGTTSGTLNFSGLPTGNYEVRAFYNFQTPYTIRASASFSIGCSPSQTLCSGICVDTQTNPNYCGNCVTSCGAGGMCNSGLCVRSDILPPRLVGPLSNATVTSLRPGMRFALDSSNDGARVDVCTNRTCSTILTTFNVNGSSGAPSADLPTGRLFWRARGLRSNAMGTNFTGVWGFTTGVRSAAVNTSYRPVLDVNSDGYTDVVVGAPRTASGGTMYVYTGGASGLPANPTRTNVSTDGAIGQYGNPIVNAGDVNGDGYSDVFVGAFGATNYAGAGYVYHGSSTGITGASAVRLTSSDGTDAQYGGRAAPAGDVNGDGYGDLIIGAPGAAANAGTAYVYLGSASGITNGSVVQLPLPGGAARFGFGVAGGGDVNGDGYSDVVVGAYDSSSSAGSAYVYLGSMSGIATTPSRTLTGTGTERFGWAISMAGDVNGDGYTDVAVGAPNENGIGHVYVYYGGAAGLSASPATTLTDSTQYRRFGIAISMADLNNDGYSDVITGGSYTSALGWTYAYLSTGAGGLSTTAATTLTGTDGPNSWFGASLADPGDINGDGTADVVIGAYLADTNTGHVFVFPASAGGISSTASTILVGPDGTYSRFGAYIN